MSKPIIDKFLRLAAPEGPSPREIRQAIADNGMGVPEVLAAAFCNLVVAPLVPAVPDAPCFEPDTDGAAEALEVPGMTQVHWYTCGVTSSWSVLNAMGWKIGFRRWLRTCREAGCNLFGMDEDELAKALKRVGAKLVVKPCHRRDSAVRETKRLIAEGVPPLFGTGHDISDEGDHWQYAYGYSEKHVWVGNVVCPGRSKERWTWTRFKRELNPIQVCHIAQR